MWCICMCVLRERVGGEKSVSNENDLESVHALPQETTGVFCWDPQSHSSQGMGAPSNQAKFLPLSCPLGQLGLSRSGRGKSRAMKQWFYECSTVTSFLSHVTSSTMAGGQVWWPPGINITSTCTIPGGHVPYHRVG